MPRLAELHRFSTDTALNVLILRGESVEEKLHFPWTRIIAGVHHDEAVGLPLSDAKEFAKDRGANVSSTLASFRQAADSKGISLADGWARSGETRNR
jgi:hypothetical protein